MKEKKELKRQLQICSETEEGKFYANMERILQSGVNDMKSMWTMT